MERPNSHETLSSIDRPLPTLDELKTAQPSALSPESEINPFRLHGSPLPDRPLSVERPWHRYAAYLFATGNVNMTYVAKAVGVTEPTMRNLIRQPWFQERVTQLMANNGAKDIMALLKAEQFNALVTLVEIRDDKKTPPVVRTNICRDILDRTLGKPVQRIETEDKTFSDDPVAEVHRLKEELARDKQQEN